MVRIRVDGDVCTGHALCHLMSPDVFDVDSDTGLNKQGEFGVPDSLRAAAHRGAGACPERAITVVDRLD